MNIKTIIEANKWIKIVENHDFTASLCLRTICYGCQSACLSVCHKPLLNEKQLFLSMNLELHTAQGLIGSHGERKARGYNEGLGPSPQRSSRGRAPVGASGASLPEAEGLSAFCVSKESRKFAP